MTESIPYDMTVGRSRLEGAINLVGLTPDAEVPHPAYGCVNIKASEAVDIRTNSGIDFTGGNVTSAVLTMSSLDTTIKGHKINIIDDAQLGEIPTNSLLQFAALLQTDRFIYKVDEENVELNLPNAIRGTVITMVCDTETAPSLRVNNTTRLFGRTENTEITKHNIQNGLLELITDDIVELTCLEDGPNPVWFVRVLAQLPILHFNPGGD